MPASAPRIDVGLIELRAARKASRGLFWAVGLFSFFGNILMLTGPLYMLQVYDRVLSSRSVETLIGLSVLAAFMFTVMGVLDNARSRILARVGARFQARLERRVFDAAMRRAALKSDGANETGLSDLDSIGRLLSSPAMIALFDMPWVPVFLAVITVFHPWLGGLALAGGAALVLVSLVNQRMTQIPQMEIFKRELAANTVATRITEDAEMVRSLGMGNAAYSRWTHLRGGARLAQMTGTDLATGFSSLTKTMRLMLQSAMLGLGAYLALIGELSPGAMIAGSILMGRALAPIESAINQWALVQRGRRGWDALAELLAEIPPEPRRIDLPRPAARLEVKQATVIPPGEHVAALRIVNFAVQPGQAVGVIGPSGAGKSTLARALTGVWRPAGGSIRLDGAALDQYTPEKLGEYIGYLPQRVQLFDGTIAENIARLSPTRDDAKVVEAARMADAHDMILKLPNGYDTAVGANGGRLSGGQIQRIGLARALYGDPVILVLDEPNSNLDNEGSEALNQAIRTIKARGGSALIMAHRPAAIRECDLLLVLENGSRVAFGPKDEVLKNLVQNHSEIQKATSPGGVR